MKKKLCVLLFGMCLTSMSACGNNTPSNNLDNHITSDSKTDMIDSIKTEPESEQEADQDEKNSDTVFEDMNHEDANVDTELVDGMRPEFKEAMDSYEAFYDEYCNVMKKYNKNPTDIELLTSYTDMLTKSAEMSKKFEAWKDNEMNDAELKYYLDVNNRVAKKLLDVSK